MPARPVQIQALPRENSQRIDALRFLLVIAIVVIHARGHKVEIDGSAVGPASLGGAAWFLQEILSSVVARTAVPLFFLFSGFLAAASLLRHGYANVLKARVRTLLIPFLFWNALVFVLHAVASPGSWTTANPLAIFGVTGLPAAYHFWFVRDLILLVALSPLFLFAARIAPWPTTVGVLAYWFYSTEALLWSGMPFSPSAVCFFQIGAILCLHRISITRRWLALATVAYAPLAIADALFPDTTPAGAWFHAGVLLVGMLAIWHLGGLLTRHHPLPTFLTGSAFMVYAAHEPLLGAMQKVSYFLFQPDGDLSVTTIYLLTAGATVGVCILANQIACRIAPRSHALITGGRGLAAPH